MNGKCPVSQEVNICSSSQYVHNYYLYAASDLVRAMDFNNTVDVFVPKLVGKNIWFKVKQLTVLLCLSLV